MARIRTVKPEFFRHENLFEAESSTGLPLRLAYIGLWTCCDKEGRFRWRPRVLKLDVLPFDDIDFSRVLDALRTRGFVVRYEVDSDLYGYIPTFKDHQHINNKEPDSRLPVPKEEVVDITKEEKESFTREPRVNHACATYREREMEREHGKDITDMSDSAVAEPDRSADATMPSPSEKTEARTPKTIKGVPYDSVAEIFNFWKKTMGHPGAHLDDKRKKSIASALNCGYSVMDLCKAIRGCSKTPHNIGMNDRGQRYDGIDLILRNADQIDRFRKNDDNPPKIMGQADMRSARNEQVFRDFLEG